MTCSKIRVRIVIVAAVVCCSMSWAENQQGSAFPKYILAITNSGGTSLGAYEAGYDYYFTEWLKKNHNKFDAKIVTGTSAGSINAFLTFIALANGSPIACPDSSIFYKSWTDIGFCRVRGPQTRLGFLGRQGLESIAKIYAQAQMDSANRACDMILGITATRLKALDQVVAPGLEVPTVKQRFMVLGTVTADTTKPKGYRWSCRNYIDPEATTSVPVLPLRKNDSTGAYWPVLYHLALASVGIPGLFQPLPLTHLQIVPFMLRHSDSLQMDLVVNDDLYDTLLIAKRKHPLAKGVSPDSVWRYVDGGVLDNSPIRLAFQIAQSAFDRSGNLKKAPEGVQYRRDSGAGGVYYLYISPDNCIFPNLETHFRTDTASIYEVLLRGVGDWVRSARANELFTLKEEYPKVYRSLLVSSNNYPTFSRLLGELFGFLEKDIRIFDFYLGMYDAQKYLCSELHSNPKFSSETISEPCFESGKFDSIREMLDGKIACDTSTNFDKLVMLSRELYFQYWETPEGKVKKRACAREFAAAFCKMQDTLPGALRDGLVTRHKVNPSVFEKCSTLVESLAGGAGHENALLDSIFDCIEKFHVNVANTVQGIEDSLALSELPCSAASQPTHHPLSSGLTLIKEILGYRSPVLEHYLEAEGRRDSDSVSKQIDTVLKDICDSTEFGKVLDCLYNMHFRYHDIPLLDREWHFSQDSGKWMPEGKPGEPECLTRREVETKIKSALFNMLRDYGDVPGGPELERNVVNVFGNPLLGFISDSRPRYILYGSIAAPSGGEIGMSFKSDSDYFRWIIAANIDSLKLGNIVPLGQGLCMSYRVPWYLLLGFEVELLWKPWIQCRLGLETGPDVSEFWDGLVNLSRGQTYQDINGPAFRDLNYKLQAEFSVSLMERLRISIALATRARTWQNFFGGVTPSVSLGGEVFSW